jgi:hypothetical protein
MAPAGRPRLGKELRKRYQITLDPEVAELIRGYGNGSLTAGINVLFIGQIAEDSRKAHARKKRRA